VNVCLLLLRPGKGAEYCAQFVGRSVCLSAVYLWNRWTDLREICSADPCVRGSVFLWRRCDMLCTSGFMDDVTFGRSGPWRLHVYTANGVAIPGWSLMSMNALFYRKVVVRVNVKW